MAGSSCTRLKEGLGIESSAQIPFALCSLMTDFERLRTRLVWVCYENAAAYSKLTWTSLVSVAALASNGDVLLNDSWYGSTAMVGAML